MKYYLGQDNGSGMEFNNIRDFLDAIADIAETYTENGNESFQVSIVEEGEGQRDDG